MTIYPWLARRVLIPLHSRWERNGYSREWATLERSQWWLPQDLRRLQEERLHALLEFAHREVPFYGERAAASGNDPWSRLAGLPVVDKSMVQKTPPAFQAGPTWTSRATWDATGGSTGEPLSYLIDLDRWGTRKGATFRHNAWAGLTPGTANLVLWGQPGDFGPPRSRREAFRRTLLERAIPVDASRLSSERFQELARLIREGRARVLVAYGGALALFVNYLERENITDLRLKSVISSAEVLPPKTREKVRDRLKAPVYDRYGCREFSVIASECEAHDGMHVNNEHLVVEILAGERPAHPGEVGEVVITDLLNRAQPFIRYRIGDLATPLEGPCRCGRGLSRLKLLGGRVTEFVVTPSRGWVSGVSLATYLITKLPGVAHVRIEQEERDRVTLRARPVQDQPLPVAELQSRAARLLGSDMTILVVEDPTLRPEGSGKFRFSVSRFDPLGATLDEVQEPSP